MINLQSLRRGVQLAPPRIVLYGPHGLGKSTFGASAPGAVFIQTEDGLGTIDTTSFPICQDWAEVSQCIDTLLNEDHNFGTAVIDTLDWLEPIIWAETCRRHGQTDIESFGYGKGYMHAADVWREFLDGMNALRHRGLATILISHCEVKRFDDPRSEPYDRYQIKLQPRASALVQEWADAVLFVNYRTMVAKSDVGFNKKKNRGITTGERLLHTQETPAYIAKNRYNLPAELPLSWESFQAALNLTMQGT